MAARRLHVAAGRGNWWVKGCVRHLRSPLDPGFEAGTALRTRRRSRRAQPGRRRCRSRGLGSRASIRRLSWNHARARGGATWRRGRSEGPGAGTDRVYAGAVAQAGDRVSDLRQACQDPDSTSTRCHKVGVGWSRVLLACTCSLWSEDDGRRPRRGFSKWV